MKRTLLPAALCSLVPFNVEGPDSASLQHLTKRAEAGDKDAQFDLGVRHATGDRLAPSNKAQLSRSMTPDELTRARHRAVALRETIRDRRERSPEASRFRRADGALPRILTHEWGGSSRVAIHDRGRRRPIRHLPQPTNPT